MVWGLYRPVCYIQFMVSKKKQVQETSKSLKKLKHHPLTTSIRVQSWLHISQISENQNYFV